VLEADAVTMETPPHFRLAAGKNYKAEKTNIEANVTPPTGSG